VPSRDTVRATKKKERQSELILWRNSLYARGKKEKARRKIYIYTGKKGGGKKRITGVVPRQPAGALGIHTKREHCLDEGADSHSLSEEKSWRERTTPQKNQRAIIREIARGERDSVQRSAIKKRKKDALGIAVSTTH